MTVVFTEDEAAKVRAERGRRMGEGSWTRDDDAMGARGAARTAIWLNDAVSAEMEARASMVG